MIPRNEKGAILVASLWILSILAILAMGIGFRVSVEARLSKYNMDRMKAIYLAKAGLAKAVYRLAKKPSGSYDSLYACGTVFSPEEESDPEKFKAIFNGSLGEGSFSVGYKESGLNYTGMADEERRININTASENILKNLLVYAGEDPMIASDIAQWRQAAPGLDDGYYDSLPFPYKCKHQKFSSPEELLLVKGVKPAVFDKIKDYITVFGPDKFAININTAPKAVLSAVIMADASVSPPIDKITADFCSDKIIALRNGYDAKPGDKNDFIFTAPDVNLEQITLGALSATQSANLTKDFTTKSNYFRIESTGLVGKTRIEKRIVLIVKKDQGKAQKSLSYREY